jgi:signal transduction histidine kinase
MKAPAFPDNEAERQKEVDKYQLLDTLPEESYDTITALMAYICEVPISLVSIIDRDRNFLKSHHGIPFNEDPRDRSFCGHAIVADVDIMIVPDTTADERFRDNPLVSEMGVRFYAGAPLINPNGYKLGTLCVFDMKPKDLNQHQVQALMNMSKQVMLIMEERFKNIKLNQDQNELLQSNEDLKKIASTVSHDLRSPLANIMGLAEILTKSLEGKIDDESAKCIQLIGKSGESLSNYITGMLEFYQSEELLEKNHQQTSTKELFKSIKDVFSTERDVAFQFDSSLNTIEVNTGALNQILVNLVANGIKYNAKQKRMIKIRLKEEAENYKFEIEDNGEGMDAKESEKVFELFETNNKIDRFGKTGTGIGLATVKKLIENLNGTIWIESTPKVGTTVNFTLPKSK